METYSSGNVVVMTGIPAYTISLYIRDFRSYFDVPPLFVPLSMLVQPAEIG